MADDGPADVTPPELTEPSITGPSITGDPRVNDDPDVRDPRGRRGKGVPQVVTPPPSHPAYAVSPGSLGDASNEILNQTQQSLNAYEDLKSTVQGGGWIFWERAPFTHFTEQLTGKTVYMTDQHPELTNQIIAVEDNLLLEIADSITLAGQFADQLNNAAQFYAKADKASVLPEMALGPDAGTIRQGPIPGGPAVPAHTPPAGPKSGGADPPPDGKDPKFDWKPWPGRSPS